MSWFGVGGWIYKSITALHPSLCILSPPIFWAQKEQVYLSVSLMQANRDFSVVFLAALTMIAVWYPWWYLGLFVYAEGKSPWDTQTNALETHKPMLSRARAVESTTNAVHGLGVKFLGWEGCGRELKTGSLVSSVVHCYFLQFRILLCFVVINEAQKIRNLFYRNPYVRASFYLFIVWFSNV